MIYIFTFTGEFGYELLNWRSVIKKFKDTLHPNDKIICCSRKGLERMYDFSICDQFIDISELEKFKNSEADQYQCLPVVDGSGTRNGAHEFQLELEQDVQQYVFSIIDLSELEHQFIFSHNPKSIRGIQFGGGTIYDTPVLSNNTYTKISCDFSRELQLNLEEKLGFRLSTNYTLIQTAYRHTVRRSKVELDHEKLFEYFDAPNIVLLDFNTNRFNDSFSKFENDGKTVISLDNFDEQACLIHYATECIFLTEGDFRSHNYIPPLLGKDVVSVAPKDVLNLPSSAIKFWNKNVFKFGGQIIPLEYEQIIKETDE